MLFPGQKTAIIAASIVAGLSLVGSVDYYIIKTTAGAEIVASNEMSDNLYQEYQEPTGDSTEPGQNVPQYPVTDAPGNVFLCAEKGNSNTYQELEGNTSKVIHSFSAKTWTTAFDACLNQAWWDNQASA
jgi:hypothetical protein